MRLVTRRIWRAFPELDRFDDEQCERFVRAANLRQDLRVWRAGAAGLTLMVFGLIPLWAAWIEEAGHGGGLWTGRPVDEWLHTLWWHKPLLVFFSVHASFWLVGVLAAALVRDVLLRRRVRQVMVSHGTCAACSYFLGGLPVDRFFRITCPECGGQVRVHPSLVELAPTGGGGLFKPSNENIGEE